MLHHEVLNSASRFLFTDADLKNSRENIIFIMKVSAEESAVRIIDFETLKRYDGDR